MKQLRDLDGAKADTTDTQLIEGYLKSDQRLALGAAVLFCTSLVASLLLIFAVRTNAAPRPAASRATAS